MPVCLYPQSNREPGAAVSNDEKTREQKLLDRIYQRRLLRDAQDPTGVLHLHFQREIEAATTELLELQRVAPEVERTTELLVSAERALRRAELESGPGGDPWSSVAGFCGVVGAVLLLVALRLGLGPVTPLVGVALLASAGLALSASVRHRRDAAGRVEDAAAEVAGLSARLDALSPRPSVSADRDWDR